MHHKTQIVGLGEILWDMLPGGKMLGGAPANFAYHTNRLGARASIVSAIGEDDLGNEILKKLDAMNLVSEDIIRLKNKPTGTVSVELDPAGHPSYHIHEKVAWDFLSISEKTTALIASADAVCFGTLAQRSPLSKHTINYYLKKTKSDCLRVFDINLRQKYYSKKLIEESLGYANVLKLNEDELEVLTEMFCLKNTESERLFSLLKKFNLNLIALTKGKEGSILVTPGHQTEHKSIISRVEDTVGAGDSFTAALVTGLLKGMELETVHRLASEVAAFVCTRKGGTPEVPGDLILEFK